MGERITALAIQDPSVQLVGGFVEKNHPTVGKLIAGTSLTVSADASVVSQAEVMIDFSVLEALPEHVAACQKYRKALVVGTTGLKESELSLLKAASKEIPIVQSPNMSRGMNVLFKLVELAASALSSYDTEVIEAHHHFKKDAPSGSALKLGEHLAKALQRDLNQVGVHGREGLVGERKPTEIGFHAVRAGDIVGDHTVMLAGPGERLELIHRAHSRDTFAAGAIEAAKWVVKQKPGLYSMLDVLGI